MLKQNDLRDDGVTDLFERVHHLPKLAYLTIVSNKITSFVLPNFVKFVQKLD